VYFLEDFSAVLHASGSAAHPHSIAFTSRIKLYYSPAVPTSYIVYCPNFIWDVCAVAPLAVANKRRIHERGAANLRVIVVRAAPSDSAVAENCNKKHVCRVASRRVGFSLLRRRLTLQSRIKTAMTQRISLTGSICNTIRDRVV
jgi:hypothetical protein